MSGMRETTNKNANNGKESRSACDAKTNEVT